MRPQGGAGAGNLPGVSRTGLCCVRRFQSAQPPARGQPHGISERARDRGVGPRGITERARDRGEGPRGISERSRRRGESRTGFVLPGRAGWQAPLGVSERSRHRGKTRSEMCERPRGRCDDGPEDCRGRIARRAASPEAPRPGKRRCEPGSASPPCSGARSARRCQRRCPRSPAICGTSVAVYGGGCVRVGYARPYRPGEGRDFVEGGAEAA